MERWIAELLNEGQDVTLTLQAGGDVLRHGGTVKGTVVRLSDKHLVVLPREPIPIPLGDVTRVDSTTPDDGIRRISPSVALRPDSPTSELHPNRIEEAG